MPVIVVGADTDLGGSILDALVLPDREVRAFVSDPATADRLRSAGVKVALGDLSDQSHVASACTGCFSAVLLATAATDGRPLAFGAPGPAILRGWAQAVTESRVRRVIWVVGGEVPDTPSAEVATVDPSLGTEETTRRVVMLDDAAALP